MCVQITVGYIRLPPDSWARIKGACANKHWVSPHATGLLSHGNKSVCANKHCVSPHATRLLSHGNKSVCADNHRVTLHAIGPLSHYSRIETFLGLGRKTLTSLGTVQMTTLVSASQRARMPLVDKGAHNPKVSPHATGPLIPTDSK